MGAAIAAHLLRSGVRPAIVTRPGKSVRDGPVETVLSPCYAGPVKLPRESWRRSLPAQGSDGPRTIFVATKTYHLDRVASQLRSVVGPDDTIVLTQNGLDVEERLAEGFGLDQILRLVVNFGSVIEGRSARITYMAPPNAIGHLSESARGRCSETAGLLASARLETVPSDDIGRDAWKKLIVGSMAPVCALHNLGIKEALASRECTDLLKRLVVERLRVAKAVGYSFGDEFLDRCLEYNRAAAAHVPSMLVDRRRGRPLEIEHQVGKVVSYALSHSLSVPANEEVLERLRRIMKGVGA